MRPFSFIVIMSVLVLLCSALFAYVLRYDAHVADSSPYIMIRKDSMERIMQSPCMSGTIEYMGNYILCRRRADYEPRESRYWPSPYPEKS